MVDKFILRAASLELDGTEQAVIPIKYVDNRDGSYSEQVSITTIGGGAISALPEHDEIVITNNASGSPTIIVYKLATVIVLTITNTYDGRNFLTSSVRS